jgi:hypothetical protein
MPLPLLVLAGLAVKAVVAKAAAAHTVAVVAKGTAVLAKAAAGHGAVVAKAAAVATKTYGATAVISTAAVATVSIGAATIMYDKARKLKRELDNRNTADALVAASSLIGELRGIGGLDDVRSTLDAFVSSSGHGYLSELAAQISALLMSLESRLKGT